MVKKENPIFLFIGQEAFSKDAKLKKLKEEFLSRDTEYFNLDMLYAKDLTLKDLQERLLCLPLRAKKRLVVIKDSQNLKEEIKKFIIKYVKDPQGETLLVLDINKYSAQDEFIKQISRYAEVVRFREPAHLDAFTLSRSIDLKKTSYALWVLNQLFRNGEKPERILGGLRYSWEHNITDALQIQRRLKLLLNCDIDIKSGRLRPDFALERLVVNLCCLAKPSG